TRRLADRKRPRELTILGTSVLVHRHSALPPPRGRPPLHTLCRQYRTRTNPPQANAAIRPRFPRPGGFRANPGHGPPIAGNVGRHRPRLPGVPRAPGTRTVLGGSTR